MKKFLNWLDHEWDVDLTLPEFIGLVVVAILTAALMWAIVSAIIIIGGVK